MIYITKEMKKNPLLLIASVLVIVVIGGFVFSSCSSAPGSNNSQTANKTALNTAAASTPPTTTQQTIPANAPPGAEPPEQMGSPNATVTLEEFADLQCSACAAAHPTINEIKGLYGSKIHFIFRNFPLQIPAHDKSYDAAIAASAAGMQGKFWDMQNMLFQNQKAWSSDPGYKDIWKGYAQKIGLNIEKWQNDMGSMGTAKSRVDKDIERGKAVGINSTPTLFINGKAVQFADMKVDALKTMIDAELQKAPGQNPAAANKESAPAKSDNAKH